MSAELQRAKRASEAPWVNKIGNPSSRENLGMTSAYERASEQTPSVQTLGEGEGHLEVSLTGIYICLMPDEDENFIWWLFSFGFLKMIMSRANEDYP